MPALYWLVQFLVNLRRESWRDVPSPYRLPAAGMQSNYGNLRFFPVERLMGFRFGLSLRAGTHSGCWNISAR